MTSERLNEYFADEAGDYLEQLDLILRQPDEPDAERLLRLAAGVRGSTKMAGADSIARLAGRLEEAARSVGASRLSWNDGIQDAARKTVSEIQELVQALKWWGPVEENRVQEALDHWDRVVDRGALDPRPVVPIDSLFHDDDGPHVVGIGDVGHDESAQEVPIESLLLRGDAAIHEALALRDAFDSAARGDALPERPLPDLVTELFDLLALALTPDSPEV
jgi:HPt (histidine-containing phosphotransfer) domain-containing protein